MPAPPWHPPPAPLLLAPGEVHVWRASLRCGPDALARLHGTLADEERTQAARFVFPEHRDRFVAGRGIQRAILGRYLGRAPESLRFQSGPLGKPWLEGMLRFNVSNCGDRALYAVALGREVGVDLEEVRGMPDAQRIAEQFFSPAERLALRRVPSAQRAAAFFAAWTRKEAFIKAKGGGLSIPLDAFDVTLAPGEPARLLRTRDPGEAERWSMRDLDVGPGWAAALVVEGSEGRLCRFECPAGG